MRTGQHAPGPGRPSGGRFRGENGAGGAPQATIPGHLPRTGRETRLVQPFLSAPSTFCGIYNAHKVFLMFFNYLFKSTFSKILSYILVCLYFIFVFYDKEGIFASGDVRPNWLSKDLHFSDLDLWLNMNFGRPNEFSSGIALWILWNLGHMLNINLVTIDTTIHIISRIIAFSGASRLFGIGVSAPLLPQLVAAYYVIHIEWITNPLPYAIWSRALLPWVLFYGHRILIIRTQSSKYTSNVLLLSWGLFFLITQTSENLAQTLLHFFVFLYLLLYFRSEMFINIYNNNIISLFHLIIINLPNILQILIIWIMPVIFNLAKINIDTNLASWEWTQINYSSQQILQFNNYWYFNSQYFANYDMLNSVYQRTINMFPFICYFFILSVNIKKYKNIDLFYLSSLLIYLILQGGKHTPLAAVGKMIESFPGLFILREPSTKAGVYLLIIYGFLILRSYELLPRKPGILNLQYIFLVIITCTIFIQGVLLSPKYIFVKSDVVPSKLININSEMIQMRKIIQEIIPSSDKTLVIPSGKTCHYMQQYSWGYYGADFLFSRFLRRNEINLNNEPYFITNQKSALKILALENIFINRLNDDYIINKDNLLSMFSDLSIKNVAIRKDFQCESIAYAETILHDNNEIFSKIYENKLITLYHIKNNYMLTSKSCTRDIHSISPSIMWFISNDVQECHDKIIVPITFHPGWIMISSLNIRELFLEGIMKKIVFLPTEYDGFLYWKSNDWSHGHVYWIVFAPTLIYWILLLGSIIYSLIVIYRKV